MNDACKLEIWASDDDDNDNDKCAELSCLRALCLLGLLSGLLGLLGLWQNPGLCCILLQDTWAICSWVSSASISSKSSVTNMSSATREAACSTVYRRNGTTFTILASHCCPSSRLMIEEGIMVLLGTTGFFHRAIADFAAVRALAAPFRAE